MNPSNLPPSSDANYNHALATAINAVYLHMSLAPTPRSIVTDADAAAVRVICDTLCTISIYEEVGQVSPAQATGATKGRLHPGVAAALEALAQADPEGSAIVPEAHTEPQS